MSPEILHTYDPKVVPLLRALGIPNPEGCTRVMIDFKIGQVVKAYVQRFPQDVDLDGVVDLDVSVEVVEIAP